MQRIAGVAGLALVLGLLPGCSHITVLRIQELKQVQTRVDSLRMELVALQRQIIQEQKKQNEILRLIRADQQVRFDEVNRGLSAVVGNVSESQVRLSQISEQTRAIKKRWEEKAIADSMVDAARAAEVESLYEIALGDFTAGRYEIAHSGFQDLLTRFPDSPQAEDAMYWSAECHYAQKAYDQAENGYKAYYKSYGDGRNVCVTLYKLGLVYEKMKKEKSRDLVWTRLITQCSDSEEAQAAKARMGNR